MMSRGRGGGSYQGEGGCCKIYTMVGVTDLEGKGVFFPTASVFRTFCPAFLLKTLLMKKAFAL